MGSTLLVRVLVVVGILTAAPLAMAADPFYAGMLREGNLDLERGEHRAAERKLRIACFGLLDEPALLASALASLAIAQSDGGMAAELVATIGKLATVEERFHVCATAEIPGARRHRLAEIVQRLADEGSVGKELALLLASSLEAPDAEPSPASPGPAGGPSAP